MSLPSYVINLDEFNKMLARALSVNSTISKYSPKINFIEKTQRIDKTELSSLFRFNFDEDVLIYGIYAIQSCFSNLDYFQILLRGKDEHIIEKVIDVPMNRSSIAIYLDHPIPVSNAELIIKFINNSNNTRRINFGLRFIEGIV